MPRSLRLVLPGVAVHVIQRGNNRTACFRQDSDYLVYLAHLRQLSVKHECLIHAYCLMTNHVHLLLTPSGTQGCTTLMQDLGQRYVQYFNRRYDRSGTLWEGRFRSCVAESSRYVLACYRYIELNPVRAGMVGRAAEYPWSSHAVNNGTRSDAFVSHHAEFLALGVKEEQRFAAYRVLFEAGVDEPLQQAIRDATNAGYPLTSDIFKASVIAPLGWKTAPAKSGPKSNSGSDPEPRKRVRALTPN